MTDYESEPESVVAEAVAEPVAEAPASVAEIPASEPVAEVPAPDWLVNPAADQTRHSQVPVCAEDGSVVEMQFFNACGQRVR
jgi:hypothetical protein